MDRSNAALTSRVTVARRRKWLSLLLDTDNEKIAAAYEKYDQLHKTNVADDIKETVRILYNEGHKEIADKICNRFGKTGVDFLRPIYEEHRN